MAKTDTLIANNKRAAKDAARQQARMNKGKLNQHTDRFTIRFSKNQVEFERTKIFN